MHEIFTTKRIDRIFFQSSRSCVKKFEQCHKSSNFGKPLLVYIEPLGQIDHAQGQIHCSNTGTLFPRQNLSHSSYFLSLRKFLCYFFSALRSKDYSSNMSLSSGSYMVSQATLVELTADCYCCVLFTLVTIVIF